MLSLKLYYHNIFLTIQRIFKNRTLVHVLFWFAYYILHIHQYELDPKRYFDLDNLIFSWTNLIFIMFLFYSFTYLLKKHAFESPILWIKFALLTIIVIFIHYYYGLDFTKWLANILNANTPKMKSYIADYRIPTPFEFKLFGLYLGKLKFPTIIFIELFPTVLKIFKLIYFTATENNSLITKNLDLRMKIIKGKSNPSSMMKNFKKLQNLIISEDKKTPEIILKYSNFLRYSLYDSDVRRVALDNEIENILNYIELEKAFAKNKDNISFINNIESESDYSIAPKIVLYIIELCFEYFKNKIKIELSNNQENLSMTIVGDYKSDLLLNDDINILEIRKRLKLEYPDKHSFNLIELNENFKVNLILKLITNKI